MKMMIALRRVSTPTTPITNNTAEKKSASASIGLSPAAKDDCANDRREQQHARQLERQQVFREQRLRDRSDRTLRFHLRGDRTRLEREERQRNLHAREREDLGEHRESDAARREFPSETARISQFGRMSEVEQHDHEEEHD